MKNVFVSVALLFLVSVAVVPVPAWATSEQDAGSVVSSSEVNPDNSSSVDPDVGAGITELDPEPSAEPDASSSAGATSEPDSSADPVEDEWQIYEVTPVEDVEPTPEPTAVPTIWEKDFQEYTPTEGYLFLIFALMLTGTVIELFKRGGI